MTEAAASLPPGQGELLVVDDEPFLREAVAASLRFLGFEVTTAENGAGALRLARDRPFDLVVLDVMLPDTDGFEVARRLTAAQGQPGGRGQPGPVIVLTSTREASDYGGRIAASPAAGFLPKDQLSARALRGYLDGGGLNGEPA